MRIICSSCCIVNFSDVTVMDKLDAPLQSLWGCHCCNKVGWRLLQENWHFFMLTKISLSIKLCSALIASTALITFAVLFAEVNVFVLHIQAHLIHISHLPHGFEAWQLSVVLYSSDVQIHWRPTDTTPGLEESIIAPLTLGLHPPLLAFLPSLINRPALRALLCS